MDISVVIPTFNSAIYIEKTVQDLVNALNAHFSSHSFEIVLVDDFSNVATQKKLRQIFVAEENLRVVFLHKNSGQHFATLVGCGVASGDIICTIDDDSQHDLSALRDGIRILLRNVEIDLVYGTPDAKSQPLSRRVFGRVLRQSMAWLTGNPLILAQSSLRIFRRDLLANYRGNLGMEATVDSILLSRSSRALSIQARNFPRSAGKSNYNLFRLIKVALAYITLFSSRPLLLSLLVGFFLIVIALVLASWSVWVSLSNPYREPGFASLLLAIVAGFGLNFTAIGILGAYLGRIIDMLKGNEGSLSKFEELK